MTVRILTSEELETAADLLNSGAVVGVPTDTVYGLAARLDDDASVRRLFAAKQRPSSVPVAVLCAAAGDAREVSSSWPDRAATLAARFWPGPLTIVVDADERLAARLGALRGVGVRVPDDELCRSLLRRTGPLAVSSANRHGEPPAASAADVAAAFADADVAAVLDGGTRGGVVSS